MLEVNLTTLAEKKKWFAVANGWLVGLVLSSVFGLVWGRILENASLFILSLVALISLVGISAALRLLNALKWMSTYLPKSLESIGLTENYLLIGKKKIAIDTLKSVVTESDGYAGKMTAGRRGFQTGCGRPTFVHRLDKSEESHLISIQSSVMMNNSRKLAEGWRKQGLTSFIMD